MPELTAHQRYATLQNLGVTLWVARKRLVGAQPSVLCDWPAPEPQVSAREKLRAEIQPQPEPKKAPEITAQEVPLAPVLESPPQQQALPLVADVWLLANGWQLVMERQANQPLTQQTLSLLQSLLTAFYPGGLGILSQHRFQWPLPGVPVEAGDEEELNLSLRAFLTGAQFRQRLSGLLVFGSRASDLLTREAALSLPEVYAAPALDDLINRSEAKQHFWQQAGENGLRARFASSPLLL
ncbi:hypothetical protein SAMN05660443_2079 [Marinospirillum celere]|uniref:Uncharacterized protein n=1 Tax=Marinospirillum celere TaxID=1122252 RepID=A0A1I1HWY1_9GAMM|nr:hypothetical protein [Marinospirillum celere]SFC28679.1 hypothetical protein SAMN05660443_2079 [Marinospirillum celere]